MPKSAPHTSPPLEVRVMFEPHRREHDLLQVAYAFLVPQSRRRLVTGQPSLVAPVAHLRDLRRERNVP